MWDWRYPIDELRSDIRESRSRGETSTTLDNLETRVDEIESMFERLEKDDIEKGKNEEESSYESQMKHWERYLSHFFDKASEYNRIVIAGAFVAYFAVWLRVYETIDRTLSTWSVLFVFISLVIFVLWEVGVNIYMSRNLRDEAALFNKSGKEYVEAKERAESEKRKSKIGVTPIWYAVLLVTIATGLIGSGLLLASLIMLVV